MKFKHISSVFLVVIAMIFGLWQSIFAGESMLPSIDTPTPHVTQDVSSFYPETNDDWTPIEQEFDGVIMVLVPAGCFEMGNDPDAPYLDGMNWISGVPDGGTQCFDEPFWIDKYEVTNEQYGSIGCPDIPSEPDQPHSCIAWFDAQAFCESRDAYLPTEAEWEYAARGVDGWMYPWGNLYDESLVIGEDDPTYGDISAAPVGSRLDGASWVGAMDMSGNLQEWVDSHYNEYPYVETQEPGNLRVLRGGSFVDYPNGLRSAVRFPSYPQGISYASGFRCARSID